MDFQRWLEAKRNGARNPFDSARYYGSKDTPATPDYTGAAQQQGQASKEITNMQTWANRPTVVTPWGKQSWDTSATTDPATGQQVTNWTQNIQLTPEMQQALQSQQAIQQGRSGAAQQLLGQATQATANPMDWSTLPSSFSFGAPTAADGNIANAGSVQTSLPGGNNYRDTAQEAVWQRMQPDLQMRRNQTETSLLNAGVTKGSEAWDNAQRQLAASEDQARLSAIDSGRQEAAQQFGQDLSSANLNNSGQQQQFSQNQAQTQQKNSALAQTLQSMLQYGGYQNSLRSTALGENLQKRNQPLNELNSLLTGQQVSNPFSMNFTNAQASQTPDLMGALQSTYGANINSFNARNAAAASNMQGLTSAGLSAAMFML